MILYVYPHRAFVIGNSSLHFSHDMGNELPLYARSFKLLVPANAPMICNTTLHLVMEIEDHTSVCDELSST